MMAVQLGFADHVVAGVRSRRRDWLGEIEGLVDWAGVAALLRPLRRGETGRPRYPVLVLFRALLLQRWYDLSDEGLEDALADRLSFRRFAGLALEDAVPDASTLCRFRGDLAGAGLADAVFACVDAGPVVVQGDEAAVYADKAYSSARMRARLAATGAADRVMRRADKHHPLGPADHARNAAIGRVRGRVEAVFGTLKRSYRRHRLRYMGLARNQLDLLLTLTAMNLRRARLLTSG